MGRHVKKDEFKVGLNAKDAAALRKLAAIERDRRQDPEIGASTLLREFAMPLVHARLVELAAPQPAGVQ